MMFSFFFSVETRAFTITKPTREFKINHNIQNIQLQRNTFVIIHNHQPVLQPSLHQYCSRCQPENQIDTQHTINVPKQPTNTLNKHTFTTCFHSLGEFYDPTHLFLKVHSLLTSKTPGPEGIHGDITQFSI